MLSTSQNHLFPTNIGKSYTTSRLQSASIHAMATNGLDALAEGSHYAMQQLQQQQQQQDGGAMGSQQRQSSNHGNGNGSVDVRDTNTTEENTTPEKGGRSGTGTNQPVRKRISRACDQCNQLRTKCDGKTPCAHCVEFALTCEYARERKKRGKASRKDVAAQQAAAAAAGDGAENSPNSAIDHSEGAPRSESRSEMHSGVKRRRSSASFQAPQLPPQQRTLSNASQHAVHPGLNRAGFESTGGSITGIGLGDANGADRAAQRTNPLEQQPAVGLPTPRVPVAPMQERGMSMGISDYGSIDDYHRSILHHGSMVSGQNILHTGPSPMPHSIIQGGTITGYGESPYAIASPGSQQGLNQQPYQLGGSPLSANFLRQSPVAGSPGWLSLPSPSAALYPPLQQMPPSNQTLRYPVLRPLLPHISAIIPIGLACDLLDLYFQSASSVFMQPHSPYVLGYLFRKKSFLRQNNPRTCSPALLASMLWVAAQTSESAFLTSSPSARGKICQKLLELTVGLLKPLIHTPLDGQQYGGNTVNNGVALGGFGVALPGQSHETEGGSPGASAALDDVATYLHLATVVSASEYKAASLRWWNAAWSLARELKLGRELPPNPERQNPDGPEAEAEATGEAGPHRAGGLGSNNQPGFVTEEEREERRRIWWLLYMVDRHLAICYNRPLFLLDIECDGLLQPDNEASWQAGEHYPSENHAETAFYRRRGPSFDCSGHSLYGFFLPLMTILGEIIDLNHARNHPRFGLRFKNSTDWDDQVNEITNQLEAYGQSLQDFASRNLNPPDPTQAPGDAANGNEPSTSPRSANTSTSNPNRLSEAALQTKIILAYGTHLMHTMHILLNGKWDPISLLDDNDLWISSQSFISATGHAVSAAEAINEILEYDPDLSFMPFFFGIYLLQGSFLLLLIADKLQAEASQSVVKACETIVRAHEACVVTLNTEYQRNFRKVMRSALAQVRGRHEDFGELRRREVLALYRWTGDGTGLAL